MKRVQIVGIAPRTGTTLLMEMMVSCFEFDGWADHELELFFAPNPRVDRFCSKCPKDLKICLDALNRQPDLWVVCLVRDPRDVIVSRHQKQKDAFWAHLGFIKDRYKFLMAARRHPHFIEVKYESLVSDPDQIQRYLTEKISFLSVTQLFSKFHEVAKPTEDAKMALGGLRKISTSSIGRWRQELPRVKAQIERYGLNKDILISLGYEKDGNWTTLLKDVVPENGKSHFEDSAANKRSLLKIIRRRYYRWRDRIGIPVKRRIIVRDNSR